MPGILLPRNQIVKRFPPIFPACPDPKRRTPLGGPAILPPEQPLECKHFVKPLPSLSGHGSAGLQGGVLSTLTNGDFRLYSGVYGSRILARGGAEFGGGGIADAAERVIRPPGSRGSPPCSESCFSALLLEAHSPRGI